MGAFHNLLKKILTEDSQDLKDYIMRVNKPQFNQLIDNLSTRFIKRRLPIQIIHLYRQKKLHAISLKTLTPICNHTRRKKCWKTGSKYA